MTRNEILQTAKPILFNTEMVRAILDGRKTATRRPLKPHNAVKAKKCGYEQGSGLWYDDTFNEGDKDTHIKDYSVSCCWIGTKIYIQKYAPYKVGDILYVRETWKQATCDPAGGGYALTDIYVYKADGPIDTTGMNVEAKWHPSIHMPKEAARIFLRVTDVHVERLQDITNEQAIKEGFIDFDTEPAVVGFVETWDEMVKKSELDKYGWDANPWVLVIEFERAEVE